MKILFNVSGKAGTGKTTAAEYLQDKHGFEHLSWAANLKIMCMEIFNLTEKQVYTQEGKLIPLEIPIILNEQHLGKIITWMQNTVPYYFSENITEEKLNSMIGTKFEIPRYCLQYVGTDVCRTFYSNYHVDVIKQQIKKSNSKRFVISDSRFENELTAPLNWNLNKVKNIKLVRPNNPIQAGTHISEQDLPGDFFDIIINNNENLNELFNQLNNIFEYTMINLIHRGK